MRTRAVLAVTFISVLSVVGIPSVAATPCTGAACDPVGTAEQACSAVLASCPLASVDPLLGVLGVPDASIPEVTDTEDFFDASDDPAGLVVDNEWQNLLLACESVVTGPLVNDCSAGGYPAGDENYVEHVFSTPCCWGNAPMRTGYWPGGTSKGGFGRIKVQRKHNIQNPIKLLQDCIDWGHDARKETDNRGRVRVVFRCGFTKDGYNFNIRVVTNLNDTLGDGLKFGLVTAWCEGYDDCPNVVNEPYRQRA